MAEAWPAEVAAPTETADNLAQMRRGLLRARGSFTLFIAVSNSPRRSRELIRLLEDAVPGMEVVELEPGVEDPLAAVIERAEPEASGPLMVLGLERSLSTDEETAPLLRVLNMQRERWPKALRRPVVLWVPDFLLELLGRSAPDFLDWRSGTFFFAEEEQAEGDGGARSVFLSMDAAVWKGGLDEGLPAADRWRRIEELRSRLASTDESSDRVVLAARARWLYELGIHLWRLGQWKEAERHVRDAAMLADELGDRGNRAAADHQLGLIAQERGAYDEALDWYRKSLAVKEELGNRAGMARSYHQLGTVTEERGTYDEALDWYRKSLAIEEEFGDRAGMAGSYHQLGMLAQKRGAYDEALDWYRKSLAILEDVGNRAGTTVSYHQLGMLAQRGGAYNEALDWYRKSLAIKEELGDRAGMASSYHQLGMLAQQRGAYDEALDWYRKSLAIKEQLGNRAGMANSYHQLGLIAQQRGAYHEAFDWYQKSLAVAEELRHRAGMASSLSQIGVLWTVRGDPAKGLPLNLRSLALRLELRVPEVAINVHWLRRQRDLLGEEPFREIVEREGVVAPEVVERLLSESSAAASPTPTPATA